MANSNGGDAAWGITDDRSGAASGRLAGRFAVESGVAAAPFVSDAEKQARAEAHAVEVRGLTKTVVEERHGAHGFSDFHHGG